MAQQWNNKTMYLSFIERDSRKPSEQRREIQTNSTTYHVSSGNRTRVTLVGSERSHTCLFSLIHFASPESAYTCVEHWATTVLNTSLDFCFNRFLIASDVAPVEGHWGRWGPWTQCSQTCGQGFSQRSRQCDDPLPLYGGKYCSGAFVEVRPCQLRNKCKCSHLISILTDFAFVVR